MPKPAYLLDTNIVSDLVRRPAGRIRDCIAECGEERVCTSIIVAHALAQGLTLVTANESELRRVPGLVVENWLSQGPTNELPEIQK